MNRNDCTATALVPTVMSVFRPALRRTRWCWPAVVAFFGVATWLILGAAPNPAQSERPSANGPQLRLNRPADAKGKATIEVVGLDPVDLAKLARVDWAADQWAALLAVYVDSGTPPDKGRPPVLGSYRVEGDKLCFEPRFGLERALRYRAVFEPSRLPAATVDRPAVVADFLLPKPPAVASTVVEQIYPSRNQLPENHLKFYFHFSAPMSQGSVARHVHILNADGKEIELAFLEMEQELWDPQGKRLTLFLNPGRIKRGLKPREDLGPVLEEGKTYTLVVDREWADAEGNPLKAAFRKTFRVTGPDDQPPYTKLWKLQPPPAGTAKPLLVIFPEPLDRALLERLLDVTDAKGQPLPGQVLVTDEETRWQFIPAQSWLPGRYHLVADTTLEDHAGNNLAGPFEVDVFGPIQRKVEAKTVQLPFEVGAPGTAK